MIRFPIHNSHKNVIIINKNGVRRDFYDKIFKIVRCPNE